MYLKHYGVSIRDGAPGPGTGNYDRSGHGYRMNVKNLSHAKDYPKFTSSDEKRFTQENPVERLSDIKRLPEKADISKVRKDINNQTYKDNGRFYNCQNCAVAFDMVERGYDVKSRPKPNGSNVGNIETYFKNGKLTNAGIDEYDGSYVKAYELYDKNSDNRILPAIFRKKYSKTFWDKYNQIQNDAEQKVVSTIKEQGNGSRGIMVVGWQTSVDPKDRTTLYHAINYKVVKGDVIFYDTQSSWKYDGYSDSSFISWNCDPRELYVMQTNNLEISENVGEAVISNRRGK